MLSRTSHSTPARNRHTGQRRSPRDVLRIWRSRRRWRQIAAVALIFLACALVLRDRAMSTAVVAVRTDLPAGHVFSATDLHLVSVPSALAGQAYFFAVDDVVGHVAQGPLSAGEFVTSTRLVSASDGPAANQRVVSVPVADLGTLGLLHPGSVVDVLVAGDGFAAPETVARAVQVVDIPRDQRGEPAGTVAITAAPEVATTLAGLALNQPLAIAIVR